MGPIRYLKGIAIQFPNDRALVQLGILKARDLQRHSVQFDPGRPPRKQVEELRIGRMHSFTP